MRLLLLLAALVSLSQDAWAFGRTRGQGGPARTQTLWLPLTTTPTPGVAAGSAAWTFTRADAVTCASYINSAGIMAYAPKNEARFDYDPVTLKALGYLSEGSRTNSAKWSQAFTATGAWSINSATFSPESIAGVDGISATWYAFVESAAGGSVSHYILQTVAITASKFVSVEVYARAGSRSWLCVDLYNATKGYEAAQYFNLATNALGTTTNNSPNLTISAPAIVTGTSNGWKKCTLTLWNDSQSSVSVYLMMAKADGAPSPAYVGDGTSSIYVSAVQVEDNAAFPSSYIPTTTAAVTRALDTLTYSSPANCPTTEGTVMATYNVGVVSGNAPLLLFASGQSYLSAHPSLYGGVFAYDGTTNAFGPTGAVGQSYMRGAISWQAGRFVAYSNANPGTPVVFTGPYNVGTTLTIPSTSQPSFGHLRDVRIWSSALTAREIATLQTNLGPP